MVLVTVLCYLGFIALCLSMSRHYDGLVGGALSRGRSRMFKLAGWGALLLSLWVALDVERSGLALVQWFAALMGSAVLLVFVMSYWPRLAVSLAVIGVLLGPIAAFIQ